MAWSGAMQRVVSRGGALGAALALLTLGVAAAPAGAEDGQGVGQVLAVVGEARAVAPDGRVRRLHCFDRVYAGEVIFTEGGSRVGILSEEVYAQLDPGANVAYGRASGGVPELRILDGSVRLVDTRPGGEGPQLRVETPEGRLRSFGADMRVAVERYDLRERTEVCEAASPVEIARFRPTDAIERASAGECALVTSAGRIDKAPRKREREVTLAGADACRVGTLGTLAARLTPTDVAAPPFGLTTFPARDPAPATAREPCDDPGSGCGAALPAAPAPGPGELGDRGQPGGQEPTPDFGDDLPPSLPGAGG